MHASSNHTQPERDHSGEIGQLAYHLWQTCGSPCGQDVHFWLQAERQLLGANHCGTTAKAAPQAASKGARVTRPASKQPQPSRPKASRGA